MKKIEKQSNPKVMNSLKCKNLYQDFKMLKQVLLEQQWIF